MDNINTLIDRLVEGEDLDSVLSAKQVTKKTLSIFEVGDPVLVESIDLPGVVESYDPISDTYRLNDPKGDYLGIYESSDISVLGEQSDPKDSSKATDVPDQGALPPVSNDSTKDRIKTEYAVFMGVVPSAIPTFVKVFDEYYGRTSKSDWFLEKESEDGHKSLKPNQKIIDQLQKELDRLLKQNEDS